VFSALAPLPSTDRAASVNPELPCTDTLLHRFPQRCRMESSPGKPLPFTGKQPVKILTTSEYRRSFL
jgi:hypothetical protein